MNDNLTLGGVYKTDWDEQPFRIIGLDNVEVFYDCLWPHDKSWAISGSIKKKCYFYRTSREWFGEKSEFLKNLPFTKEEQDVFRPDLPIWFGRNRELKWNSFEVSGSRSS